VRQQWHGHNEAHSSRKEKRKSSLSHKGNVKGGYGVEAARVHGHLVPAVGVQVPYTDVLFIPSAYCIAVVINFHKRTTQRDLCKFVLLRASIWQSLEWIQVARRCWALLICIGRKSFVSSGPVSISLLILFPYQISS
jgi:hypothetical protein